MWRKSVQRTYLYYLKTAGTCAVFVGSFWVFHQLRQISKKLGSAVAKDILQLDQSQAQYIYLDDPQLADIIFQNNVDLQYYIKKNQESIFNKIAAWWKSLVLKKSFIQLQLAQMGSSRALYSLGMTQDLKDWHYRQMAQMLDSKTAVALARIPNVDIRFFINPPFSNKQHSLKDLILELQNLLIGLNNCCKDKHLCLSQFITKSFKIPNDDVSIFEHDLVSVDLAPTPRIVYDQDLLQNCVFAIGHHTSIEQYSKDMIHIGGLSSLMQVKQMFGDNLNICISLAKILANVSLNTDCLEHIYQSGWIGVLAEWAQHDDIRLSVTASKALANLDAGDSKTEQFSQHIYLLHPLHKRHTKQKLDVIFIHGLLGGIFITWRQRNRELLPLKSTNVEEKNVQDVVESISEHPTEFVSDLARDFKKMDWKKVGKDFQVVLHDCPEYTNCESDTILFVENDSCLAEMDDDEHSWTQCWPKDWLPIDTPNVRVLGVDYTTNLSMWTPFCPIESQKGTLKDRSDELVYKLATAGVGKRPIVWVCHSMGGLLVKNMLIEESKNNDPHGLCKNTRGIVFYSTPHKGSNVAALKPATKMLLWPSIEVQELRENSPELLKMHTNFLEFLKKYHVDVVTFGETKPTLVRSLKYHFVTPESADPGIGEFYAIPQDHLRICKPANRQSFLYRKVLSMVKHYINAS